MGNRNTGNAMKLGNLNHVPKICLNINVNSVNTENSQIHHCFGHNIRFRSNAQNFHYTKCHKRLKYLHFHIDLGAEY